MEDKLINIETHRLQEIKIRYDKTGGKEKEQLKVEWYKKVKDIAAIIRRKKD
jgi:hypothetical protein